MRGAPPLKIITSENRHASVDRAVRYLGLGEREIVAVADDRRGRMRGVAFDKVLRACGDVAKIVVLDAADLNIAAFDAFTELIPKRRHSMLGCMSMVHSAFSPEPVCARSTSPRVSNWLTVGQPTCTSGSMSPSIVALLRCEIIPHTARR